MSKKQNEHQKFPEHKPKSLICSFCVIWITEICMWLQRKLNWTQVDCLPAVCTVSPVEQKTTFQRCKQTRKGSVILNISFTLSWHPQRDALTLSNDGFIVKILAFYLLLPRNVPVEHADNIFMNVQLLEQWVPTCMNMNRTAEKTHFCCTRWCFPFSVFPTLHFSSEFSDELTSRVQGEQMQPVMRGCKQTVLNFKGSQAIKV